MKKIFALLLVVALVASFVVACGNGDDGDDGIVIGFSQPTMDSPFYTALVERAEAVADELGVELIVVDAANDVQTQNNDIADLLVRGIDALILNPVDADGVAPSVIAANEAGVPIITVDRPINEEVFSFVGRDNENMGRMIGEFAVELLGGQGNAEGVVWEVLGAAGCQVMMARSAGFRGPIDAEPGIEVIQSPHSDYIRSNALVATSDILQTRQDITLVYAHNDDMALGALQAFMDAGLEDVYIVGVDGLMEAVQSIAAGGNFKATAMNDPGALGQLVIEQAMAAINGEAGIREIDAGSRVIDITNAADFVDPSKMFAELN